MHKLVVLIASWLLQVIGAVGFMNNRLEIPEDVDPQWASIIEGCWQRFAILSLCHASYFSFLPLSYKYPNTDINCCFIKVGQTAVELNAEINSCSYLEVVALTKQGQNCKLITKIVHFENNLAFWVVLSAIL